MDFKGSLLQGALKLGSMAYDYFKQPHNTNPQLINNLKSKLQFCTYDRGNINEITRHSMELLQSYPSTKIQVKSFDQAYSISVVLQFELEVLVFNAGKEYPVMLKVLFPKHFPSHPPLIKIVNPDPSRFQANQIYENRGSKVEGSSYIINSLLISVNNWNRHSSKVNEVINDAKNMMCSNFPFYKKKQGGENFGFVSGSNGWGSNFNNNFNNNLNHPQGERNQPQNNVYNRPNQWQSPPQNNNGSWFQTKKLNPKQQKAKEEVQIFIVSGITTKQEIQLMLNFIKPDQKLFLNKQQLDIVGSILSNQIQSMTTSIQKLRKFVQSSESLDLQNIKLIDLVQPDNALSGQLLDLIAQHKTQVEMFSFVQNKFMNDEINLETFMKLARKIQDEKFMSKYMTRKIVEKLKEKA